MQIHLAHSQLNTQSHIALEASKSEANRWLILQALFPGIELKSLSTADDVQVLHRALQQQTGGTIDVHHAGTAMRFLTSYLALHTDQSWVLTGSERMQQRPIKPLVDALQAAGAVIAYLGEHGYPPLQIQGKKTLQIEAFQVDASSSSQYASSLALAASAMDKPTRIRFKGEVASVPYFEMTLKAIASIGGAYTWEANEVLLTPIPSEVQRAITVESDWSSASYWYSLVALSPLGTQVTLSHFQENSWQGDAQLQYIFKALGVHSEFNGTELQLTRVPAAISHLALDLSNTPDIAQTLAVTALGLGISCHLTGLQTLRIKETDRLNALQMELNKLGAQVTLTTSSLAFAAVPKLKAGVSIATYQDHRMALAFAPLALRVPLQIEQAEVVSKSYVKYWQDLEKAGIQLHRTAQF